MKPPTFRLRTLMLLVAAIAVLASVARSHDGRITLVVAGLVLLGLAVAGVLSAGIDRAVGSLISKFRRR